MKSNNEKKMPKAPSAGNGTKPHVASSTCNYVETILHGLAPCHAPTKSYREVVYALKSALIFANNLPQGAALTGQLCDVANLIWDYENTRLKELNKDKKVCPECGSNRVYVFDADNDACKDCGKYFPAV